MSDWLTINQVAARKGCHPATVRRAIKRGKFPIEILNPGASEYRREIRIPQTRQLENWQPEPYRRNKQ